MNLPDINTILNLNEHNFNAIALQLFQFQAKNNAVYSEYIQLIDKQPDKVEHFTDIPFLPISFFKTHKVVSSTFEAETIFESSSTTGTGTSKHLVRHLSDYHATAKKIIESLVGQLNKYEILGLLPNYLERGNSSLVNMVKAFMDMNSQDDSFYLYEHDALNTKLLASGNKILFGVSFALLDFAEKYKVNSKDLTIIETGGMKGRKKELTKSEVYSALRASFPEAQIISEYGMTELTSQAYSNEEGIYTCPSWMKILPRTDNDPLKLQEYGKTAALNIIDLANIHSCAFIATDDLGKVYNDGRFEVVGRLDHADLRGCSLMV